MIDLLEIQFPPKIMLSMISDMISSVAPLFSDSSSSTASTISSVSGLSSHEVHGHHFEFSDTGMKKNLRLSSSLQEISSYHQIDPEKGNLNVWSDSGENHQLQRENDSLSILKEKVLPGIPFFRKKWARLIMWLCSVSLFMFLMYMILIKVFTNWSHLHTSQFYVVLDCGSTGTRVYIYQASADQKKGSSLPIVLKSVPESFILKRISQSGSAYNRMETEPGLDKLVRNVSGLSKSIKPLLQWAEQRIPNDAHKKTYLFLCATAGVRRLPSSDSKWLLDNAWLILKTSPFLCERDWVRIISGMEEAYYGWISLNYLQGLLGTVPKKLTFGSLDLGGSSLQVTFENSENMRNKSGVSLSIGDLYYHLSAYSLPGYGLNDAFEKSVVHLFRRHLGITKPDNITIELKHPCLQSGYREPYVCSQCNSMYQKLGNPPIDEIDSSIGGKPGFSLMLIGAPNWEECTALAKVAINLSEWSDRNPGLNCEMQPCALSSGLAHPYGDFYAMSGFFVVYKFFNLTPEAMLHDVLEKGRRFCEKSWKAARTSVPPQPFIEQYCFRAPYIVLILREGLHISDSHINISSGSITWTLGVALLQAGKSFPHRNRMGLYSYKILQIKINPFILFPILLISLFLLICALSCAGNWVLKFLRKSSYHLPVSWHGGTSSTPLHRFQQWNPLGSGDGRGKMALSPKVGRREEERGSAERGMEAMQSASLCAASSSGSAISHSYSSSSLGQLQFDNISMGSCWSVHRSQMRLQSRRSQSRDDLISSLDDPRT